MRGYPRFGVLVDELARKISAMLPFSWISADTFTVSGVSGKVASYPDIVTPGTGIRAVSADHVFAQATSANQNAVPVADAALRGQLSATFSTTFYDSSAPATNWKFIHSGAGYESFVVFVPTAFATNYLLFGTTATAANGILCFVADASGYQDQTYGAAGIISPAVAGAGVFSNGVGTYINSSYLEGGGSPEFVRRIRTAVVRTGDSSGAPSSSDSAYTLRVGAVPNVDTIPFVGRWATQLIFNRVLTSTERSVVQEYFAVKYGLK